MSYVWLMIDIDGTLPMSYFDKDEKTSNFKYLFSGDATIVVTPSDLY